METLEKIRELRKSKGITQNEMAEQLGIAKNNYSNLERGATQLTIERLQDLAKILSVPIIYFLSNNDFTYISKTELEEYYRLKNESNKEIKQEFEGHVKQQLNDKSILDEATVNILTDLHQDNHELLESFRNETNYLKGIIDKKEQKIEMISDSLFEKIEISGKLIKTKEIVEELELELETFNYTNEIQSMLPYYIEDALEYLMIDFPTKKQYGNDHDTLLKITTAKAWQLACFDWFKRTRKWLQNNDDRELYISSKSSDYLRLVNSTTFDINTYHYNDDFFLLYEYYQHFLNKKEVNLLDLSCFSGDEQDREEELEELEILKKHQLR